MRTPPFLTDWPAPTWQELAGQFVTLRPTDPERDAPGLYAAGHVGNGIEGIWRYMATPGPLDSPDAVRAYLETLVGRTDWLPFTVVRAGTPVGMISILRIEPEHGVAELGAIWYAPDAQRTKVNTESVYLLLKHLFETGGYRRIEWKCDARNVPSSRAATRLGFTYEGCFRQHQVRKGENRDTLWFSMLDHEWPERRAALARWLYSGDAFSLAAFHAHLPAAP
jgi:RimJ/RimL family protein N-acetyltransferase